MHITVLQESSAVLSVVDGCFNLLKGLAQDPHLDPVSSAGCRSHRESPSKILTKVIFNTIHENITEFMGKAHSGT